MTQTNYDTGARLEPYIWPGDSGRVDLDTDEGSTALTVYAEPADDGSYRLHIEQHTAAAVQITID